MTFASVLRVAAVVGACIALAACTAPTTSGSPTPQPVTAEQYFVPVAVPGIQPCRRLSTAGTIQEGTSQDGLPSFGLPCLTERGHIDVSRFGGKPTLVNLWASWCGPCREEMPVLQAGYEQGGGRVQFVGIDTRDDPASAAEYLPEVGVIYPQLVDSDGLLLEHTRIPGLPVTLLLDEDGVEVARHVGPLTADELADLLDQL